MERLREESTHFGTGFFAVLISYSGGSNMSYYSNPTENAAIGAVDRELKAMKKRASRLRYLKRRGLLSAAEEAQARKEFVGIYRRLLRDALNA